MANKESNIRSNFLYNCIYQILLMILPLLTSPYISRVLGSDGLGIFSYTFSMATTFALVGMLGVNNYGNRTISTVRDDRKKRSKAFWNIWSIQFIVTFAILIVYIIYVGFYCPMEYRLISWIQVITILCSAIDINWFFFGLEKFKLTVTRNIIIKISNVLMIFLFVKNKEDVWIYTAIIIGGMLISNIVIWPFLFEEVDFIMPKIKDIIPHFKKTIILFVPVIAVTLYNKIDKVMIGTFSTMVQTGLYENTDKIITIPLSFITALGTVMLPRMSYLFAKGEKDETLKYISLSMEFVCFMSSAMTFGIAGIAIEFAPIFFGEEFIATGTLIMALSPKIICISLANVLRTQYLIPLHKDKVYVISVWLGAIVNVIVNLLLVPSMGAMGAVIGTIIAEAIVVIYQTIAVWNELPILDYIKKGIYYFFAGIAMFLVIRVIGNKMQISILTVIVQIIVGALVYLVIVLPYIHLNHKEELKIEQFLKCKNNNKNEVF